MSRTVPPTLGGEAAAAMQHTIARVREQLDDENPMVVLRAAAELTKLVGVCARAKLFLPSDFETVEPQQPESFPVQQRVTPETAKPTGPTPRPKPKLMSIPDSLDAEPWCDPVRHHHPLPAGGPQFTSFLGKPPSGQKPPDCGKSV